MYRTRLFAGPAVTAFLVLGLVVVLSSSPAQAQVLYGSIVGNVRDQTGAAIPGADVTVINQETNFTRRVITDDVGTFRFVTVQPGPCTVKVNMPGFKEFVKTDIPVTVNSLTRANVVMELGEVTETLTVTAETATLQTDRAEVRAEMTEEKFVNLPVPLGRNYQDLFKVLPGFSPPNEAHSIQTNPSRARRFNVNGISDSINSTRIDGAASINPQLPHITGYVPPLESIETVNVVTNSFDAEQGLAGGAAITVQLKSGNNDWRGSAFMYHHDNALRAKRFLYPYPEGLQKGKFIYNQWGGTLGGPIKKDKLFFFVSYEGTANSRFASRVGSVPTPRVKSGDFSPLGKTIYDPLTGNPDGTGRLPFPNNVIPIGRMDPIAKKIIDKIPNPNVPGRLNKESSNYFGTGRFTWDKWTTDAKIDWNVSDTLNMFGRMSVLTYDVTQPTMFGDAGLVGDALRSHGAGGGNPGTGQGTTWNWSLGSTYVASPHFVIDGNFGFARFVTDSRNPFYGVNVGLDVLGIPGTNGPAGFAEGAKGFVETYKWQSGFPNFELSGYADYGNQQDYMPYYRRDEQFQYTLNFNWTRGKHEIRWGLDLNRQDMNQIQSEDGPGGSRGRFDFSRDVVRLCTKPDGQGGCKKLSSSTSRASFAALFLGMPNRIAKNKLTVLPFTTRYWLRGLYIRDRWQVTPKFTLSYGTRWEYFAIPTRDDTGFGRYDPAINKVLVGGVGEVPMDMGVSVSKRMFAPRLGFAYRATNTFVIRAGYGITNDPYTLSRDLRTNYPVLVDLVQPSNYSWQPVILSLSEGIPPLPDPDLGNGIIDIPGNLEVRGLQAPNYRRGYIQSWNLTLQKELKGGLTGEAGYVASRHIRGIGRWDVNYADIGTGQQGRQLFKKFGRTARTLISMPIGGGHYDSLQARLQRRFVQGFSLDVNYTWSKGIVNAFGGNDSDNTLRINIPEYFHLNRQLSDIDRTHNLQIMNIWQLPFGRGEKWLSDRGFLSRLVGGWQVNSIVSMYSGRPMNVDSPGGVLNAPGNSQRADLVGPIRKLGGVGPGQPYYDPSAFKEVTEPRFGTAAFAVLRRPGVFNWDFGVFRNFRVSEEVNIQFRMEAFNFTNTPHLGTPDNDVNDRTFLEIDEADNERQFRFGLRLAW